MKHATRSLAPHRLGGFRHPASGKAARALLLWAVAVVRHLGLWRERMRQRRALANLDDRLLRDVGLTRYDAEWECRKPFWR